jgi:ferredoxin
MVNGTANLTSVKMATPSGFIVYWDDRRCILCENCIKACPNQAICLVEEEVVIDQGKCQRCGTCVETCAMGARDLVSKETPQPRHCK